jgi:enterochelin esterase family protein
VARAAGNLAPGGGRGAGAAAAPAGPAALGAFAQDFVGDLMPAVERTFRARTGRQDRAMAGLSAGGAATVNTAFSRPDLFSHVVIMSAGAGQNVEASYPNFFGNNAAGAKQLQMVRVGVGDQDFALAGSRALSETLTKNGVKHEFVVNEGYRHEWRLWRLHMTQFVPKLFR